MFLQIQPHSDVAWLFNCIYAPPIHFHPLILPSLAQAMKFGFLKFEEVAILCSSAELG